MKKMIIGLLGMLVCLHMHAWDDEKLFMSWAGNVKPNLVLLQDTSGSMKEAIFHREYDPAGLPNADKGRLVPLSLRVNELHYRWRDGSSGAIYGPAYATIPRGKVENRQHFFVLQVAGDNDYLKENDWLCAKIGNEDDVRLTGRILTKALVEIGGKNYYDIRLYDDSVTGDLVAAKTYDVAAVAKILAVTGNELKLDTNGGASVVAGEYIATLNNQAWGRVASIVESGVNYLAYLDAATSCGEFAAGQMVYMTRYSVPHRQQIATELYGSTTKQSSVDYEEKDYQRWIFGKAAPSVLENITAISRFAQKMDFRYGTRVPPGADLIAEWNSLFPDDPVDPLRGLYSNCHPISNETNLPLAVRDGSGYYRYKMIFTRIQVVREAIGTVARTSRDKVNLALFKFPAKDEEVSESDEHGILVRELKDYGKPRIGARANLNPFLDSVWGFNPNGGTPVAIALADVWRYYKPGPSSPGSNRPYSSGDGYWPISENFGFENIDGRLCPQGSPIRYYCQKNYVVLVTDGISTQDQNLTVLDCYDVFKEKPIRRIHGTPAAGEYWKTDYDFGWGDADSNDRTGGGLPVPANYFDDIAYFIYHQDMFPTRDMNGNLSPDLYKEEDSDPALVWKGDQNISTYAIGLAFKNETLTEAAVNGNGRSFSVNNYSELESGFAEIIDDIMLKELETMYAVFAAPKQSVSEGIFGCLANFFPRNGATVWEGHLKRFRLGDDGNFPDNIDLLHKGNKGKVLVGGVEVDSFQWDAFDTMNALPTAERKIKTVIDPGISLIPVDFNSSSLTKEILGVATDEARDKVIDFIRGDYGPGCGWKFGDPFHNTPTIIGHPLRWKAQFDDSYRLFYDYYAVEHPRDEVIYSGSNDGMLHCFRASDGHELWGFIPPSQLTRLQQVVKSVHADARHTYFIDGRSIAKDIRVADNHDHNDWCTILALGLGLGGTSYFALDVTRPEEPTLLWETKEERMALTEARPVIGNVRTAGGAVLPAIFLSGGYDQREVAATDLGVPIEERLRGKSFYIINAHSGKAIKKFLWGPAVSETVVDGVHVRISPDFRYAITAAPGVLDRNGDGVADCVYLLESGDFRPAAREGGRIWKIELDGEPETWKPVLIYQADAGQTFFIGPTLGFDSNYRLWIMAGTGRRSDVTAVDMDGNFNNTSGQFICLIDDALTAAVYESEPLKNSDNLIDLTTDVLAGADSGLTLNAARRGFFFDFKQAEHEVSFEPSPLFINNHVYFMTFAPSGSIMGDPDDPCASGNASGQHFFYQFGLSCSGNQVSLTDPRVENKKILGYGGLNGSEFKLYTGNGDVGGFVPKKGDPIVLDSIYGPVYWKEQKK